MSVVNSLVLSLSLSADSFAAAMGRAAQPGRVGIGRAVATGLVFAAFETAALGTGWLLGAAASGTLQALDHWVALALLVFIGARMIRDGLRRPAPGAEPGSQARAPRPLRLAGTAVATSIDAAAVGASLALAGGSWWIAAAALFAVTFAVTCAGAFLGRHLGAAAGRRAEIAGGVLLIAVGARVAVAHIGAGI